ncbi:MAG: hypothetical protein R2795_18860 [Saprospiraceae bacterium]
MNPDDIKHRISAEAYRLGFQYVGVAKAGFMEEEARRLEDWLNKGYHGKCTTWPTISISALTLPC